ncbi:MAG: phenylacetate--CoA ligase family protein [Ktedonobacteraceae bacterium]
MKKRKNNVNNHSTVLSASWDAWRTAREGKQGIAQRQQERLQELVTYARTQSKYYAHMYRDVPEQVTSINQLPVVTKAELMNHFDEWVTDPAITRHDAEAFIADPSLIGHDYLDRYVICTTSGSTGIPAILVHDHRALAVYNVLGYIRSLPVFLSSLRNIGALLHGKGRLAAIFVTGGHFLGNTMSARRRMKMPWRAKTQRLFSALTPIAELVRELNAFQPVIVGGYPSVLEVLAKEQKAGRLHIHPVLINAARETLTNAIRQHIAAAFQCSVGNYYGSSEAVGLTFECKNKQLHVNSDWYILEPVDEFDQPVPSGHLSQSVLVTNLANRVQPIIRYKMGDRVTINPDTCQCGSPFTVIHVIGRTDEILSLPTSHGEEIQIFPLAISSIAEETPGVFSCQIIQTEPLKLKVRVAVKEIGSEQSVWEALKERLEIYLVEQGITNVVLEKAPEPPQLHPKSGKFQQVWSEVKVLKSDVEVEPLKVVW